MLALYACGGSPHAADLVGKPPLEPHEGCALYESVHVVLLPVGVCKAMAGLGEAVHAWPVFTELLPILALGCLSHQLSGCMLAAVRRTWSLRYAYGMTGHLRP